MQHLALLHRVVQHQHLGFEEAGDLIFDVVTNGTPAQISAFLTAYAISGLSSAELAGFAARLRQEAVQVKSPVGNHIDTCGTGGGISSFNMSTAAAIIAAGAGAVVAKHGNRAVTGRFGSADVLETIGVHLCESADCASDHLDKIGFAFLFAPKFHPMLANVGPVRRELPFRTLFNVLGPLMNPAGAKRQIVGVWDPALLNLVGEALVKLDAEYTIVAHGEPGMDEISPVSTTQVRIIENGVMRSEEWNPATFGAQPTDLSAMLAGETAESNGQMLIESVTDVSSPKCTAVLPSAAVAITLAGLTKTWKDGYELARETVRLGKGAAKLERLRMPA